MKLVRVIQALNLQFAIFFFPRKGFYTAAVPVAVKGMFGPGAPHTFLLQRRCDSGQVFSV